MRLVLIGVSHHTAPIELRERVDFSRIGIASAAAELTARAGVSEAVVLSTCNRTELYAASEDAETGLTALTNFLADVHQISLDDLKPHLYTRIDADTARHLFRVAAGLDSLVVGEPQILGQVKDAYTASAEQQCTSAVLNKLFHWSFTAGKRVRTETGLAEGAVSVSFAALALARKIFGDLANLSVLILGAGEMAELTATHLAAQRVQKILVASRTAPHAEALAERAGGTAVPWAEFPGALASSDIVVTATGSPTPILTADDISAAMKARRSRPLFIIDIAVPRDVDPNAGNIEQVFLYNVDDLQGIVNENLTRRTAEVEQAEGIVGEEVSQFMAWLGSRGAIPTVVALRQRFEAIRQAELRRLEPKLASLPPEARARVDEITHLIVQKLLLAPTEQLKAISDHERVTAYTDALNQLFSLAEEEALAAREAAKRNRRPRAGVRSSPSGASGSWTPGGEPWE